MERYSRQILFSPIGQVGQKQLAKSTVLVVGVGALGTVVSNHLTRAGIGTLRIIDRDYVEFSNLQRQMLFDEDDVTSAQPKAIAAKNKLQKINSDVQIEAFVDHVSPENIDQFTEHVDVIIDGTDNFQTRFLLNDIAFKKKIPFAYGGVVSSRGMAALLIPEETPCLRCLMTEPTNDGQTCDTVGVIGPAVDIVSSHQVTEVLKYITNNHHDLRNAFVSFDVWNNEFTTIKYSKKDSTCLTCQHHQYPSLQVKAHDEEMILCGRNTVQIHQKETIDLKIWEKKLQAIAKTNRTPFLLHVEFDHEMKFVIFENGRVLIQGTEDIIKARTWYDRYIGS